MLVPWNPLLILFLKYDDNLGATNVPHVESATSASGVVMDRSPSGGSLGHNNESGSNLQNGDAHLSKVMLGSTFDNYITTVSIMFVLMGVN